MPPEWREGLMLQDNLTISRGLHESIRGMLAQMNKAIDTLPDLTVKYPIT